MYILSWNNMPADPDYGLVLFHSDSIGGGNRFHYSNPELDRILDEARAELNPARRVALYEQAQRILVHDKPLLFLLHGEELCALSPRIGGFVNFPPRVARLNTVYFRN
jgi:peptide/nickel transport system substrate-binding protein